MNFQVRQMEELVKLFKAVMEKRHLKYLLSKEESEVLTQFCEMSDNNRYVLMKLFIWKRTWLVFVLERDKLECTV